MLPSPTFHSDLHARILSAPRAVRLSPLLAFAAALFAMVGCGGGGGSNSSMPPPEVSVNVSPTSANVLLGTTSQFTAKVTGTSNTVVSWNVNGTSGGNSTVGTIDATGLYTAPADLPSPVSVTITATSQADVTVSNSATATVTSDIGIAAMTTPLTAAVAAGTNAGVSASISSQGKPDQRIAWSVNGIASGNSTVGTVSTTGQTTGVYQAPVTVPTPYTVSITATSVADPSKSASFPIIVAGTISSTTQNISAASGGTITLPDGSSVTIAAGVLPSDQEVTLSEVSYLPTQPPNIAITGVGPGLDLSFGTPIQFNSAADLRARPSRYLRRRSATSGGESEPAFQFSINTSSNNVGALNGSLPAADFLDAANINTFTGVEGNYDSTSQVVTGTVGFDLLHGFVDIISQIRFSEMNITNFNGILTTLPGPLSLGLDDQGNAAWGAYLGCPTDRTLVLVHGMLSSVQGGANENGAAFPAETARSIKEKGGYTSVVGFDYDWLQSITTSGNELAGFLDTLAGCQGVTMDIEAHSEGVPVSMAALTLTKEATNSVIDRLIALGGPFMGTPVANDPRILEGIVLGCQISLAADVPGDKLESLVLQAPFVNDLRISSNGDGGTLDQLRSKLTSRFQEDSPQVIVVGGSAQQLPCPNGQTIDMSWASSLMGTGNFDGIIPLTSALAFDSGLKVYPKYPLSPVGHTQLEQDSNTIIFVGLQVTETQRPSLVCSGSLACEASRTSSFDFAGASFDASQPPSIKILSQDSTGAVTALSTPNLQDTNGTMNWSMPACWQQSGLHSVFALTATLASNNVMQTVDAATCSTGAGGNITTVVGTGVAGDSGNGGPALQAQLFFPTGIAFDPSGNMFIAEANGNVVRRVDATTQIITTVAGTGVAGFSGDGGPAASAQLSEPVHVVFDESGNLYITDAGNQRIRKVDTATGIITTVAGNGIAGFSGDGGPATSAELNFPNGVGLDGAGNVYFGDSNNNRIRKIDVTTGIISTVAGNGTAGYSGDGGLATNAELNFPSRPAIDSAGNLYVADFLNNVVRRVDSTSHVIVTIAGTGAAGNSGDDGPASLAQFNGPLSITVDTNGNLYVSEINNERIRFINTGTNPVTVAGLTVQPGTIVRMAGNGVAGYQGDGGPALNAEIDYPTGLLLSPSGNLYFADAQNNVIRVISLE